MEITTWGIYIRLAHQLPTSRGSPLTTSLISYHGRDVLVLSLEQSFAGVPGVGGGHICRKVM